MCKLFFSLLSVSIVLFLAGCASTPPVYNGISFPVTDKVQVVFQEKDVPPQCTAFSHLIVHTPGKVTGADIGKHITDFAETKGADLVYIGLSRKVSGSATNKFEFFSYGPKEAYKFGKDWFGWKFGYSDWEKSGPVVGFGYHDWHDTKGIFNSGIKIQTVLLRCSEGAPLKSK
jgi:hypothetical protein